MISMVNLITSQLTAQVNSPARAQHIISPEVHPDQTVTFDLTPSSFEFYNWNQRKMAVTPGEYEVYYGDSSDTRDLKSAKVTVLYYFINHSY